MLYIVRVGRTRVKDKQAQNLCIAAYVKQSQTNLNKVQQRQTKFIGLYNF